VDAADDEPDDEPDTPPDDSLDLEQDERRRVPLAAVEQVAPLLAEGPLAGLRVGKMHGRMAAEDKDRAMREFASGALDVLVATTVIEVGVDVGNATAMVILDADRFGVSQLHQMRGRVGRGGHPGLCLLVTNAETASGARHRLDAVAETTDGFVLSRLDLEQRREGDVLGASQSGSRSGLRLLSVIAHEDVIADARAAATEVVTQDPVLAQHPDLLRAVDLLQENEQADYLQKA
jgi:ATP-dependent DNA helicase RecG